MVRFLLGLLAATFFHRHVSISVESEEDQPPPGLFLDCPECSLPSEIVGSITELDNEGHTNYFVLNCLGDHDTVAITEEYYLQNR